MLLEINYNFITKHHDIAPIVIDLNTRSGAFNLFIKYVAVKVEGQNLQQSIADLEAAWASVLPGRPFDFFFLGDRLSRAYAAEQKLSTITVIFSLLAITVACLGVFGLVTFSLERRTKELGIRKVLGIRTSQILGLISREFLVMLATALVVSIPLSYFLLESWLNGFAFRVSIGLWPFLVSGLITFVICMGSVFFHVGRVSRINPATTLKHE